MNPSDSSKPKLRARRIPTFVWILASLAILAVGVGAVVRLHGRGEFAAVQREIAAAGGWTTLAEFIDAVEVDSALQEEFWDWSERGVSTPLLSSLVEFEEWVASPPPAVVSPELASALAGRDAHYREALALLERPELVLSGHGYAAADLSPDSTIGETVTLRIPSLLALRQLATWMRIQAVVSPNGPDPYLVGLDRLVAANSPCGSLLEMMMFNAIGQFRDEAYLACIARGIVSDDRVDRWIKTPPAPFARLAQAMRGERILFQSLLVEAEFALLSDLTGSSTLGSTAFEKAVGVLATPRDWALLPRDAARATLAYYRFERRFGGDRSITVPEIAADLEDMSTRIGEMSTTLVRSLCKSALKTGVTNRAFRIAGRLFRHFRARGELPATEAELAARWPGVLRGDGDQLALRYVRMDQRSFRIDADPSSATDLVPASELVPAPLTVVPSTSLWYRGEFSVSFRVPDWIRDKHAESRSQGRTSSSK